MFPVGSLQTPTGNKPPPECNIDVNAIAAMCHKFVLHTLYSDKPWV